MDIIKGMRDSMVFTSTEFTLTRNRSPSYTHHIKGIKDPNTTNQVGTNTFFKNIIIIFKVSISLKTYQMVRLYIFITIRVPTPQKRGTKTSPLVLNTLWASYAWSQGYNMSMTIYRPGAIKPPYVWVQDQKFQGHHETHKKGFQHTTISMGSKTQVFTCNSINV